jgi:hypothetical protein
LQIFDKKTIEGHSYSVNLSNLNNLFNKPQETSTSDTPVSKEMEEKLTDSEKNIAAVQNLKKEISQQNETLRETTNNAITEIKREINDYKFNTKKFDFTCTQFLKNSDFKLPEQQNNSYKYLNGNDVIPNWKVRNIAVMNNSDDWGFETPYPKGNQALAIQNNGSISTDLHLPSGTYKVKFLANGRDCCDKTGIANPLLFSINNKVFDKITPDILEWKDYTTTIFKIVNEGRYSLSISGNNKTAVNGIVDKTSAIKNIKILRE